ncbi:hypothetical protein Hypma_012547 [Hypsizygus marmoreus]|uniref:Uncharacterized protein n=1 Tax=Hypsizygus marmoreus TaxID=39966 RepID=A0A369JET4_HYPMA|nr:hypothetical protein Hypma_012547 [Hypsizygus marmoreus]
MIDFLLATANVTSVSVNPRKQKKPDGGRFALSSTATPSAAPFQRQSTLQNTVPLLKSNTGQTRGFPHHTALFCLLGGIFLHDARCNQAHGLRRTVQHSIELQIEHLDVACAKQHSSDSGNPILQNQLYSPQLISHLCRPSNFRSVSRDEVGVSTRSTRRKPPDTSTNTHPITAYSVRQLRSRSPDGENGILRATVTTGRIRVGDRPPQCVAPREDCILAMTGNKRTVVSSMRVALLPAWVQRVDGFFLV